ncbi:hypothetical protein ACT3CD_01445 [Geofilum sp. OHC36d9]|uniref:hypothetical protein n=1 Tax=Geofilum sp. OHC36d9 TaxID=3458413 RepID=UPI0040343997
MKSALFQFLYLFIIVVFPAIEVLGSKSTRIEQVSAEWDSYSAAYDTYVRAGCHEKESFGAEPTSEYGNTAYTDQGSTTDASYNSRVSAFNAGDESDCFNGATAGTDDDIIRDNKPGNIINTADYPYWRALADTSALFAAMKEDALNNDGTETRDVMGANALLYVLDPQNRAAYIANIYDQFESRIRTMTIPISAYSSVNSHELFFALLALDVVRYDMDSDALAECEGWLEEKIFDLVLGRWDPHAWAMRMLWYKYKGDEADFQAAKQAFDTGLSEHYMPDDGVSPAGNGYCVQRWNSIERSVKNTTLNIMEYMGYNEYYTNPGIIGLKEYMYGYAVAPFGRILLYGDSRDTEAQVPWHLEGDNTILSPHIVSAARFSPDAYKYAMWVLRNGAGVTNGKLKGYLSNFLIMAGTAEKNDPIGFNTDDAQLAPSRTFKNYAVFLSHEQSTDALFLSMLNLTGNTEYHTHYETNALAMAAYGEILLRNAGYDGPGNDVTVDGVTATFDFLHSDSEAANALTIGGKRHTEKTGDGILEGLLGLDIEYFRGSGSAAIAGTHLRDVVFMQPSNGVNGYFLVMDHVTTDNADDNVNITWHPNASILKTIQGETEYFSEIKMAPGAHGPRLFSENEATLTTFLGTKPASVEIKRTANQSRSGYAYAADYMYANYCTLNNKADLLTVLFPGDKSHTTGDMDRIKSGAYFGVKIVQEAIQDIAFTSDGSTAASYDATDFKGEDVVYRKSEGQFISFFVKGLLFDDSDYGFQSEDPVALYLKASSGSGGMSGKINSKGTVVTFYCPGIESVLLDGRAVDVIESGAGWIKVEVPVGTFNVSIVSNATVLVPPFWSEKSALSALACPS